MPPTNPIARPPETPATLSPTPDWNLPHGWALALIALFALPLFLICLGTGDVRAMMELFNLVPVREAFRDHHWLIPTLGGQPRLEKPPLAVWVPAALAAWWHSDNIWILRLPSVLLGVATCWGAYAIGCVTSRDRRLGFFAALALACMLVFIRQARLANYDIYATAFTTLGLLALLAAAERPRQGWLWSLIGGAVLGLDVLSKGPVPPMYVLLPYGLWLLRFHRRQARVWWGLLIALAASVAVFLPWLVAVNAQYHAQYGGSAWAIWTRQFVRYTSASGPHFEQTNWYYLAFLGWIFPWTPALIAGLALPWLPAHSIPAPSAAEKRGRWLFWMILVLGLLLLTIPHQKKQRYALQQFPFAALLIAAVWQELIRLPKRWPLDAATKILLAAQAILIFALGCGIAVLIPVVSLAHRAPPYHEGALTLTEALALLQPALAVLHPVGWGLTALLLMLLGWQLWRWQFQRRFDRAFLAYALAGWLFMFTCYWAYFAGQGYQESRYRRPTQELVALAHGRTIYTLAGDPLWLGVLYYANQLMPQLIPAKLQAIAAADPRAPVFVLTRDRPPWATELTAIARATHRRRRVLDRLNDGHFLQTLFELSPARDGATLRPRTASVRAADLHHASQPP